MEKNMKNIRNGKYVYKCKRQYIVYLLHKMYAYQLL